MSIFPQISINTNTLIQSTGKTTLPLYKEYAWDFINNDFLLVDGKTQIVTGLDAVKVWIWKSLQTTRYKNLAYTWNYGNELENLIGQDLTEDVRKAEAQRYIEECLSINPYIQGVTNVKLSVDGSNLNVSLTVLTVYGEVTISGL